MTKEDTWIVAAGNTDDGSLSTSSYFDDDTEDNRRHRHRESRVIKGGKGSTMNSRAMKGGGGKDDHFYSSDESKGSTGSSSHYGKSSSSGGKNRTPALAQQETRWLSKARFVLIVILFVATAQTAFCTYIFTKNVDRNDIILKYREFAREIVAVTQINVQHVYETYASMSSQMTSSVQLAGESMNWPQVMFPDFGAMMGNQVIDQTGSTTVTLVPFIQESPADLDVLLKTNRHLYEEFATDHHDEWIQNSLHYYSVGGNSETTVPPRTPLPFITEWNDVTAQAPISDMYAPIAQMAPFTSEASNLLNVDALGIPSVGPMLKELKTMVDRKAGYHHALLKSNAYMHQTSDAEPAENEFDVDGHNPDDGVLAVPIYDRLVGQSSSSSSKDEHFNIVGAIVAILPWNSLFLSDLDISDERMDGIYLVVRNSCLHSDDNDDMVTSSTDQRTIAVESQQDDDEEEETPTTPTDALLALQVRRQQGAVLTYQIENKEIVFRGYGDFHDAAYGIHEIEANLTTSILAPKDENENESNNDGDGAKEQCFYTLHLYPSDEFAKTNLTNRPTTFTIAVVVIFFGISAVFLVYDLMVEGRQAKLMSLAVRSGEIVNSLFPAAVRDRLMVDKKGGGKASGHNRDYNERDEQLAGMTAVFQAVGMTPGGNTGLLTDSTPIADLFPKSTVLFGDLVGFTAWSSVREPSQVFILLETLYNSFDTSARKLGVFKVETIGDCYVAATGLPEARDDHAVIMARFARRCIAELVQVVTSLDRTLGPGTADLTMRFGIHSGPVTAGVLRGEKSRFQLFGDTVNTAARMESTGTPNRIHMSQQTVDLLIEAGKKHWVKAREELVTVKGKGDLQTYWLLLHRSSENIKGGENTSVSGDDEEAFSRSHNGLMEGIHSQSKGEKVTESLVSPTEASSATTLGSLATVPNRAVTERLVAWNVDVLEALLRKIVAMRTPEDEHRRRRMSSKALDDESKVRSRSNSVGETVLDEVREFITLPREATTYQQDPDKIALSEEVSSQLYQYVNGIASLYNDNPFHSFSHACHVSQSVMKLLSRVVTPKAPGHNPIMEVVMEGDEVSKDNNTERNKRRHEYTYGIASDPLTQFACAFSALIHDLDHPGVPNGQLVKEQTDLAALYKNKSVAEQNSVDLAWNLFMEPRFKDLRSAIYTTTEEKDRFRQLVVNAVMATDVMDKELNAMRRKRWDKAFADHSSDTSGKLSTGSHGAAHSEHDQEVSNRKATIVIEHLIQASDVAHTMQHWHVYVKWNEKLFHELYRAYRSGRTTVDPSQNWYQGELGFFDFYVIPLAKKLEECGVFGVSSDEYLTYAMANRREWELKGMQMLQQYMSNYKA